MYVMPQGSKYPDTGHRPEAITTIPDTEASTFGVRWTRKVLVHGIFGTLSPESLDLGEESDCLLVDSEADPLQSLPQRLSE